MANWKLTLDISDVWGTKDFRRIARTIADRLEELDKIEGLPVDHLVHEFQYLADDQDADVEDFDCLMEDLYDWGDTCLNHDWPTLKVCWINTF